MEDRPKHVKSGLLRDPDTQQNKILPQINVLELIVIDSFKTAWKQQ